MAMEGSVSILNALASPDGQRKKSYLNSRTREKGVKVKRASDVKESISKFLDSAQTEDLIFNAANSPNTRINGLLSSSIHATPTGNRNHELASKSAHVSKAINISPPSAENNDDAKSRRDMPFGQRTSVRKSPSHVKPKLKRKHPKRRPENRKREDEFEDDDDDDDDEDLDSFAVHDGDDDDVSISSDEGLTRSPPRSAASSQSSHHQRHSSRPVRSTRLPPSRSFSHNSKLGTRPSSSRSPTRSAPSRSQCMRSSRSSRLGSTGSIANGLGIFDRNSRRDRTKQQYHSHSRHRDDDDDGGASVASTMSARSRRNSGLEGGALNAFLGDESIARNASQGRGVTCGGTVAMSLADEKFMRDRKSRQDLIMDVARKEKWQHEAKAREEAEIVARMNGNDYDSDSSNEGGLRFGKKKGMLGNLKRAVRKSAKVARSGAKGSVNVVKDPKRAAKKVGGFAKDVGKETTKMVLDPTLAAKRTAKGVKGTVKLTTKVTGSVAKGSYGMTKSIAKTGVKGTSKVVGKTIHGATGLFHKKDGESYDDENEDYDPSALRHRQKQNTLVGRFGDDSTARDEEINSIRSAAITMRLPDILAPSIDLGGGGSWDV